MPCYTITTARLDLTKADSEVLKSALISLGFTIREATVGSLVASNYDTDVVWNTQSGLVVESRGRASKWTDKIQSAYASQVVQTVGKKFGWQVKEVATSSFQVIRR